MDPAQFGRWGCLVKFGLDNGSLPLSEVGTIASNAKRYGACPCYPFSALIVGTPRGHPMANYGGDEHNPPTMLQMIINDSDEAAAVLQAAKEQYQRDVMTEGMMKMQMPQQMMMTQQQP